MPTKTKAAAPLVEEPQYEGPEEVLEDSGDWEPQDADYSGEPEPEACEAFKFELEQPAKLTGEKLKAYFNENKDQFSHVEIAKAAGYCTITKDGKQRMLMAAFNNALLKALNGIEFSKPSAAGTGRSHAGLTQARVSSQSLLLVSQLAVRHVGAEPGDVFAVSYPGDGAILLTPTGEVKPVVPRKKSAEEPGTPLLDQAA
jgi:hypothetical protein